jgi:sulfur transfer protein SufE
MAVALDAIVSELSEADRQERIEMLIDLARSLPPLPERLSGFKDAAHRVEECQSPVFLIVELEEGSRVAIFADAPIEAPTVRGFVAWLRAFSPMSTTGSPWSPSGRRSAKPWPRSWNSRVRLHRDHSGLEPV